MADWTYKPSDGIPELHHSFQAKLYEKIKIRHGATHSSLITRINTLVRVVASAFVEANGEAVWRQDVRSCYRLWEPDAFLRPWANWEGVQGHRHALISRSKKARSSRALSQISIGHM